MMGLEIQTLACLVSDFVPSTSCYEIRVVVYRTGWNSVSQGGLIANVAPGGEGGTAYR